MRIPFARFAVVVAIGAASSAASGQSWSDTRDALTQRGIAPKVVYDGEAAANLAGGVRRASTYVGNLHMELALDVDKLANVPETTVFVDALWVHGGQPSNLSGDAQGVSNMAAPAGLRLEEAWVERNFLDNRFSLLAGRYDLNSEFYRLNSAGLFLNSSFGIGPEFAQSGIEGPSIFPNTSLGMRIAAKVSPNTVLRLAVLDGVPYDRPDGSRGAFRSGDGALVVAEAAFLSRPPADVGPSDRRFRIGRGANLPAYTDKFAMGAWYYTAAFDDLSDTTAAGLPVRRRGSHGAYLVADKRVTRGSDDANPHLSAFMQVGIGDARMNPFGSYLGAGLVGTGYVAGRPTDEWGISAAAARNGGHFIAAQQREGIAVRPAEVTLEVTYLAQIHDSLALQPDLQYIIHPGTDATLKNALMFQLRFEIAF